MSHHTPKPAVRIETVWITGLTVAQRGEPSRPASRSASAPSRVR